MAAVSWLFEKRHLKRPRLGPADVYPQDPKQKEDELTAINVKQGFITNPQIADEYGSARNQNITSAKFGAFSSAILAKKQELNTIQDSGRKRQQINPKEHFWPVTARSKNAIEAWFKDLAGSKPLTSLAKKVPIFNKKEEIFLTLFEFSVPMLRAAWFIKMTSIYSVAISEAKMKKRQLPDPSQEWTQALCKFLRELLHKLVEHSHPTNSSLQQGGTGGTSPASNPPSIPPDTAAMKQWQYCVQLTYHLYEEGLLDQQDFLTWILEHIEKTKSPDDPILKLVMPLTLQYVDEFVRSELLSRRLAHHCAKKLNQLVSNYTISSPRSQSPVVTVGAATNHTNGHRVSPDPAVPTVNPLAASFAECLRCSHHRSIVLQLSAVLQVITLECSSALVWNNIGEGKSSSVLSGSPLDLLPCPPSCLPMASRPHNAQVRQQLRRAEQQVVQRGRAAEVRWSCDKWQQTAAGTTIGRVLNALDALDRHSFDRVDVSNSLDTLYSKIFPRGEIQPQPNGEAQPLQDEPIVRLLCEWAVTTNRSGEHRALVVARLLEKRQNELNVEKYNDADLVDEKDSQDSGTGGPMGLPLFQNLLVNFLDTEAPVLDEKPSPENRTAFANLVLLFAELIHCDVFSHDAYMCTLISRGYFAGHPPGNASLGAARLDPEPSLTGFLDPGLGPSPSPVVSMPLGLGSLGIGGIGEPGRQQDSLPMFEPGSVKHEVGWDVQMDMDDARIDADLDKLLQHIKEGQQNMSDQPDSVGSDKEEGGSLHGPATPLVEVGPGGTTSSNSAAVPGSGTRSRAVRHLQYTTHFPLPQDEAGAHDCNQRHILLYGVGKLRDEARHTVKKVTKELLKLFSKKTSMDIADGAKVKRHARDAFNFEAAMARFQSLSYFDQHVVTQACASAVLEMLGGFAGGSSNYLPLVEYVAFLFELMELSFNIHGLIEFGLQLLKELVEVESQLGQKGSALCGTYATSLGLYIVGLFYRYHCCLLVSQEYTLQTCESLCKIVKHISNPAECSSAERCILCYLYDVYSCCYYLRSKHSEIFGSLYSKVKQSLYVSQTPSALNLLWNTTFMIDCINNPRTRPDGQQVKQLNENPSTRYSFVCNAVHSISVARDPDRLNDISLLCAELTANCSSLSAEWLGVLKALCCSSNHACGFIDVLTQVDVSDLSIHDNLAVFTCILVARRCFSLQDFVVHVAIPSLLSASPVGGAADQDAESGARLTCHLLLRLFRSVDPCPSMPRPLFVIRSPCDRHLLAAAHSSMRVEPVLAVLKAILVLGDAAAPCLDTKADTSQGKGEPSINELLGSIDDPDLDLRVPASLGRHPSSMSSRGTGIESAGLNDYAKYALEQICGQQWIHERSLRDPDVLCSAELLLDPMLSHKQAETLLQMICHPKGVVSSSCMGLSDALASSGEEPTDQRRVIVQILEGLDQWSLRVSWLELQLMYKQCSTPAEVNTWLENVANATIDVFQLTSEDCRPPSVLVSSPVLYERHGARLEMERIWFVAPLVAKLPATVQGKVLRAAGHVLESGNWASITSSSSSKNKEKDSKQVHKSTSLLSHQPFLSLVLMCLKGQDEQREGLLNSLYSQLNQCLNLAKDEKPALADDPKTRQLLQEALLLRLSLVGAMFDMIQRSNTLTTDWALLLVQLISYGVVDPHSNAELFFTVLDMLAVLIHTTQVSDSSSGEEMRKQYINLVKKLKKEVSDLDTDVISMVHQLLPLPKQQSEVITCEPMGSLIDTKGNKIAGFDSIDKKQGLQVSEKQFVSPWDLLEGHRNPAPLSWVWFGAVRMERKPRVEESHRALLWHTHGALAKPLSYFLDPPLLPPEDLILEPQPHQHLPPPPDKHHLQMQLLEETKRGLHEMHGAPSPRGGAKKPKAQRRPRKPKMMGAQTPPVRGSLVYPEQQQGGMYPGPQAPPQQWYGQQPPMQQQPPYYSPQQPLPPGPRFERQLSQSKAALSSMLRARHPSAQFMQGPPPPQGGAPMGGPYPNMDMLQKQRHQMMMRQQMRPQGMPPQQQVNQQGMFHPGIPQGNQGPGMHHMPGNMNQSYGTYGGPPPQMQGGGPSQGLMERRGGMMGPSGFPPQAGYPNPQQQGPNMGGMGGMGAPPGPMQNPQGQYMPNRPQYPLSQGGHNTSGGTTMVANSHLTGSGGTLVSQGSGGPAGATTGYGGAPQGAPMMSAPTHNMQQLRHQQQLMAMQKQQQQQQQTAALVAQLQRQLSGSGQVAPPQHSYQHPGPY
uniref:Putative thyroid hormone receptor-associated protein complex subunit n=1 Tax=Ornithodoros turicata TaxID=34597 RepID=A0A2R5LGN9_9ACAR